MDDQAPPDARPIVLITGAAGDIGSTLARALARDHTVVGIDRAGRKAEVPLIQADLTSAESVRQGLEDFRQRYGSRIASVIHLAAYFDFTGEEHPLYQKVNIDGTRALLQALQRFEVEQLVYSGTMLVHAPFKPGERITEEQPLGPKWAYPRSKAAAEEVIRAERGHIPVVLLHLAGVYDERRCVPTLANQIARIYERNITSYLYAGDPQAGQSLLHKADMADAFRRAVTRRHELPEEVTILIGEPDAMGYDAVQDAIGRLLHGEQAWTTLQLPKPAAKLGAALQDQLERVIPDAIDQGQKPDTDDGTREPEPPAFQRTPWQVVRDMVAGGVGLPWSLGLAMAVGAWLMFTRLALGVDGELADANHLIGALAITVAVTACAEVARPARWLNVPLGLALLAAAFAYSDGGLAQVVTAGCGVALVVLSVPRGRLHSHYGGWGERKSLAMSTP